MILSHQWQAYDEADGQGQDAQDAVLSHHEEGREDASAPQSNGGMDVANGHEGKGEGPQPIGEGALTWSGMPQSYWHTLFALDAVKERNRPVEPPKAPARAPFFLPSTLQEGQVHALTHIGHLHDIHTS